MKTLIEFINESNPFYYKRLHSKKLNDDRIDEFIRYAFDRMENEEDPNEWNNFDNVHDVFDGVYFYDGYLYNGFLDVPFNFEIGENEYTFSDAYDEIMGALAAEDENM